MISSVSSGGSMPPPPPKNDQALTTDQQTLISDTLSEFDAENLTEADALAIVETFSEAGIEPGSGLEEAMSELGFDAKTIGDLAQSSDEGSRPPPPPQQSTEDISSLVDYLAELVEEKLASSDTESLSDEDKESIMAQVFEEFEISGQTSIINTSV
jgi:hypothetical protein